MFEGQVWGETWLIQFKQVEFELLGRDPRGYVQEELGQMGLTLGTKIWAKDMNFGGTAFREVKWEERKCWWRSVYIFIPQRDKKIHVKIPWCYGNGSLA